MKKLQFVAILLLLPLLSVYGKPVSKAQAEKIAAEFMGKRRSVSAPLACMPQRARLMAPGQSAADTPPYYIFNAGNGDGFIIVSGDDAAAPVLGYSDKGAIDVDNLPDNMAAWLRLNALYVERCADGTIADGAQAAPRLLTRGVLYTAVTRARELLIAVGGEETAHRMIDNHVQSRRYSGLRLRLSSEK